MSLIVKGFNKLFNWQILSGIFLGWSLGSNDSANVFGTAVATKMVRYSTAVVLCAVFIVLGAWMEGEAGFIVFHL